MSISLFYIALFFYLISTFFYLLHLVARTRFMERIGYIFLVLAFLTHLLSTGSRYIQAGYTPITNFHESLSFFALATAAFFLYLRRVFKIDTVGSIILPALSIMLVWAAALPTTIRPLPPVLRSYWLPAHTMFSFAGNAIFFVSFFISIFYLVLERAIKRKRFLLLSEKLPSLETLDLINYRCMSYGFPFLTIGIITGSIWAGYAWGSYWSWDPKETWSLITWIVYAILLHNRLTIGWRGRKTAYMMILGFLSIMLTFFGVNLFMGGLHSYV
jgi:cytochrome c-type biogenesis protein CcsB